MFKEILAPEGAPDFVFNRQTLWNVVEHSEKRRDAQLAREIELTLPRPLSRQENIDLVRAFVRDHFVSLGMVADIAIHEPKAADGLPQPHAHIMLTLRRLDPSSETGFAKTKAREWNESPQVAQAVSEARKLYNDTGLPEHKAALEAVEAQRNVQVWRKAWQDTANRALELAGSKERIDHRTLKAQGIDREPQRSLGLARHIEKAYSYLKERLTNYVAIRKRAALYNELQYYKRRDPVKLAEFILRITDIAEEYAAKFKRPSPIPEVPIER